MTSGLVQILVVINSRQLHYCIVNQPQPDFIVEGHNRFWVELNSTNRQSLMFNCHHNSIVDASRNHIKGIRHTVFFAYREWYRPARNSFGRPANKPLSSGDWEGLPCIVCQVAQDDLRNFHYGLKAQANTKTGIPSSIAGRSYPRIRSHSGYQGLGIRPGDLVCWRQVLSRGKPVRCVTT